MKRSCLLHYIAKAAPLLSGLIVAGCSETAGSIDSGAGYIVPYITVNPEVITAVEGPGETDIAEAPEADMLSLRITDQSGNYSHTWSPLTSYSSTEPMRPGKYVVETFYGDPNREGFDSPYFYGQSTIEVVHNQTTETSITCSLANTMIEVHYTDAFRSFFEDYSVTLHSRGGDYITFSVDETHAAYLKAGDINIGLDLKLPDGRHLAFSPTSIPNALPRYFYNLTLGLEKATGEGDVADLIISFDEKTSSDDVVFPLTDEFINSKGPSLTPIGFQTDSIIRIAEGNNPDGPLQVVVSVLGRPLQSLTMTTVAPSLLAEGWPVETDILSADDEARATMSRLGLTVTDLSTLRTVGGVVDLTDVVGFLRYSSSVSSNAFIFEATDENSRISNPLTLRISTEPVDLRVTSLSDAIIGINEAEAVIEAPSASLDRNLEIQTLDRENGEWVRQEILSITPLAPSSYAVRFKVPEGTSDLHWRILYCGAVRDERELKRIAPDYNVAYDVYAMKAVVKIIASDESLRSIVTSHLSVYNGDTRLPVIERDTEKGLLTIGSLKPSAEYRLRTTLSSHPSDDDFSGAITIVTESTAEIPNGSFEDIDLTIDYKDMLSGGRYSQDYVEIFNLQNRTTFALSTPKKWANTNSKTFCTDAANHNTWYLEPSVFTVNDASDGAYAVKLTSVAWDINGPEIPDYLQESEPFVRYSRNVPRISNRSAGKLFLGSYRFDPATLEETYSEGMAINSRPSALNGYYMYRPGEDSPSDRGYVRVEVIGSIGSEEIIIARGTGLLPPIESFTAFSVGLVYDRFAVKAKRIKVFFSSSSGAGTIAQENERISTTPSLPGATSTGSELTIDNLTFSY